mgnify:CR=1 FL=1
MMVTVIGLFSKQAIGWGSAEAPGTHLLAWLLALAKLVAVRTAAPMHNARMQRSLIRPDTPVFVQAAVARRPDCCFAEQWVGSRERMVAWFVGSVCVHSVLCNQEGVTSRLEQKRCSSTV